MKQRQHLDHWITQLPSNQVSREVKKKTDRAKKDLDDFDEVFREGDLGHVLALALMQPLLLQETVTFRVSPTGNRSVSRQPPGKRHRVSPRETTPFRVSPPGKPHRFASALRETAMFRVSTPGNRNVSRHPLGQPQRFTSTPRESTPFRVRPPGKPHRFASTPRENTPFRVSPLENYTVSLQPPGKPQLSAIIDGSHGSNPPRILLNYPAPGPAAVQHRMLLFGAV